MAGARRGKGRGNRAKSWLAVEHYSCRASARQWNNEITMDFINVFFFWGGGGQNDRLK